MNKTMLFKTNHLMLLKSNKKINKKNIMYNNNQIVIRQTNEITNIYYKPIKNINNEYFKKCFLNILKPLHTNTINDINYINLFIYNQQKKKNINIQNKALKNLKIYEDILNYIGTKIDEKNIELWGKWENKKKKKKRIIMENIKNIEVYFKHHLNIMKETILGVIKLDTNRWLSNKLTKKDLFVEISVFFKIFISYYLENKDLEFFKISNNMLMKSTYHILNELGYINKYSVGYVIAGHKTINNINYIVYKKYIFRIFNNNKNYKIFKTSYVLKKSSIIPKGKKKKIFVKKMIRIEKSDVLKSLFYFVNQKLYTNIHFLSNPPEWEFIDSKTVISTDKKFKGQFIHKKPFILKHGIKKCVTKSFIEKINTLQKTKYYLNLPLFIFLSKKINLLDFFKNDVNYIFIQTIDSIYDDINISPFENYILRIYLYYVNKCINQSDYKVKLIPLQKLIYYYLPSFRFTSDIINEDKIKEINQFYQMFHKLKFNTWDYHINDLLSLVHIFNFNWASKSINFEESIWFTYNSFICNRLRQYLYPIINPQYSKLIRSIIYIPYKHNGINYKAIVYYFVDQLGVDKSYDVYNNISMYNKYYKKMMVWKKYITKINNIEEFINLPFKKKINILKLLKCMEDTTISLDATSSMLQVIALLSKNKKLMKYTNLLNYDKQDIYTYIKESLIKKIYNENNKDEFFILYNNRKIIKYICMTYIYGSSSFNIAIAIKKKFSIIILFKPLIKYVNNVLKELLLLFPVIKDVKQLTSLYIKHLGMNRSLHSKLIDGEIDYNMLLKTIVTEDITKDIKIKFYEYTKKNDDVKRKTSFFVNIIHALDALICIRTKWRLYKKDIYTLSIHDCFLTNINKTDDVIDTYNESLKHYSALNVEDIAEDLDNPMLISYEYANDTLDRIGNNHHMYILKSISYIPLKHLSNKFIEFTKLITHTYKDHKKKNPKSKIKKDDLVSELIESVEITELFDKQDLYVLRHAYIGEIAYRAYSKHIDLLDKVKSHNDIGDIEYCNSRHSLTPE